MTAMTAFPCSEVPDSVRCRRRMSIPVTIIITDKRRSTGPSNKTPRTSLFCCSPVSPSSRTRKSLKDSIGSPMTSTFEKQTPTFGNRISTASSTSSRPFFGRQRESIIYKNEHEYDSRSSFNDDSSSDEDFPVSSQYASRRSSVANIVVKHNSLRGRDYSSLPRSRPGTARRATAVVVVHHQDAESSSASSSPRSSTGGKFKEELEFEETGMEWQKIIEDEKARFETGFIWSVTTEQH